MKNLLLALLAFSFSLAASAQNTLVLDNSSSMDVQFRIFRYNGACGNTGFDVYTVPAMSTQTVTAAGSDEYVHADISADPSFCSPSFSATIGTPGTAGCNSTCTYAGSSSVTVANSCASATTSSVFAGWVDCGPGSGGTIRVFDF